MQYLGSGVWGVGKWGSGVVTACALRGEVGWWGSGKWGSGDKGDKMINIGDFT